MTSSETRELGRGSNGVSSLPSPSDLGFFALLTHTCGESFLAYTLVRLYSVNTLEFRSLPLHGLAAVKVMVVEYHASALFEALRMTGQRLLELSL